MSYKKVLEGIVQKRKEQILRATEEHSSILKNHPRLYEIELQLRKYSLNEIQGKRINKQEISRLEKEKAEIFASLGMSALPTLPPPNCNKCGDSGLIGGSYCECVKRLAILDDENISLPLRYFEDSDKSIEKKNALDSLYANLKIFVERFPNTKTKNVILLGTTGTGKTFLASIIAGEILKKGHSVVFLTAFGLLQRMLGYHTCFDSGKEDNLLPLLDCDLLIIDDLGTESILKNVTREYFYNIINERTIKKRHTLITTNLTAAEIAARYGEKVDSRLFDRNICLSCVVSGNDLRQLSASERNSNNSATK